MDIKKQVFPIIVFSLFAAPLWRILFLEIYSTKSRKLIQLF